MADNNTNGRFGLVVLDIADKDIAIPNEVIISKVDGHLYIKQQNGTVISKTVELENRLNALLAMVERSASKVYLSGYDWVINGNCTDKSKFTMGLQDNVYMTNLTTSSNNPIKITLNRPLNINSGSLIKITVKALVNTGSYPNKTMQFSLKLGDEDETYNLLLKNGISENTFIVHGISSNFKYPTLIFTPTQITSGGANGAGASISIENISIDTIVDQNNEPGILDSNYSDSNIFSNANQDPKFISTPTTITFNNVKIKSGLIAFTLLGKCDNTINNNIEIKIVNNKGTVIMDKVLLKSYLNQCVYTQNNQKFLFAGFAEKLNDTNTIEDLYTVSIIFPNTNISFGYLDFKPVMIGGYGD